MIRILHLSDPHFGAADPAIAEAFLLQAASLHPDLTVLSGDLTMRARTRELAAARDFVARLPRPLLMIPGNHDIPAFNQPIDRFFRPFRRYQNTFGPQLEPALTVPGATALSLNSTRAFGPYADWSEGHLSPLQLESLAPRFARQPAAPLRVLVLHHPLLAPPGLAREVVKPLASLLHTIHEARLDLILCGHFHLSHLATAGTLSGWKAVISQAPTVCSTRLYGQAQGFHEIIHSGARIEILLHEFSTSRFFLKSKHHFSRSPEGWVSEGHDTDEILSTL
jgi:3',5'-cyclic AMP phosphodiesterase CpdA